MTTTIEKSIYNRTYLKNFRRAVQKFVEEQIKPNVKIDDSAGEFPLKSIRALGKAGYSSILYDESLKGLNLGYTEFVIAAEEVARVDASTGLVYAMHVEASEKLYLFGTEEQKKRWLLPVREEGAFSTFAISEKATGGHVWYNLSRAEKKGDDYVLNLEKSFTTSGGYADFYITQSGSAGTNEPSAQSYFIVDGHQSGIQAKPWKALGVRGNHSGPLKMTNVVVPNNDLLQATPDDIYVNSASVIGLCAVWVGVAQAALDAALQHVTKTTNKGFNETLADHQIIRIKIADVYVKVQAARAWLLDVARHLDELHRNNESLAEVSGEVNELKVFASELADFSARTAMDVAGGYGYHQGIFEKLYRDARAGIPMAPSNNIALDQIGKVLTDKPLEMWEKGK